MLEIREFQEVLLTHPLTPAGPIPPILDPDGIYPYPSFTETSLRPVLKSYRTVRLENDLLRATVCPDLGGKIYSLVEKRSGQQVLFIPASVQPVRILPRLAFIPGGIEVSFPISHSPVQLESVAMQSRRVDNRIYVWCGERELHSGMQWTVEYSLGAGDAYLTQRTCFHNPSLQPHSWMSWSNAAVPARPDTEFHFPNGPVLRHGAELKTIDWASQGPRTAADLDRMTGFFWLQPDGNVFGAFTPSLGHGLYHLADPALAPGMKLWSYGVGAHEVWGQAASLTGESYVEIQGGPSRDQSIKETLQPGQSRSHVEYWLPSYERLNLRSMAVPAPRLLPVSEVPLFTWPPRAAVQFWLSVLQAHNAKDLARLPGAPGLEELCWAPSGMDELGAALEWAATGGGLPRDGWLFQFGSWLAARGEIDAAINVLGGSGDDRACALLGRLHFRAKGDSVKAMKAYNAIQSTAVAWHPQIVVERDLALAALGTDALKERGQWLARVAQSQDEWIVERKAAFLLDSGQPQAARKLLESIRFQLVHQRSTRTALWRRIQDELGTKDSSPPDSLGEDDLADFGVYRVHGEITSASTQVTTDSRCVRGVRQ